MKKEKNPWIYHSKETQYENPWIKVEQHEVTIPNGNPGIYGKVHFKNKAIGIIPIDEEGNTWLIGQYRYPLDEYSWEIPMGGGPIELDLLLSAQRELKEETGLTAKKWTKIARIHTSNSVTDEEGFVFLAQELEQGETEFDETEVLAIKKLPFGEVLEMVQNNTITDSISMIGIYKAASILGYLK
jgi:ADP-ribose pyrophosphatase